MKKIVSILLSTIIFCSLFSVPLSVGAKTINIESSTAAMDADCEDGYRFVERYEEGVTKDNWAYHIIKEQNINTDEYKLQEDKQFILEGIINTALNLYNNGGSSRSKLQEAHRRWVAEIEAKKEEKISRTQELSTVKIQALKELNYTKMDNSNANEVIEKILEILAKKS